MKTIILSVIILILLYVIFIDNSLCTNIINKNNNNQNEIVLNNINTYLEGYWISDDKFLKLSDIDNLILYVDIINNFGYLIIIKDKQIAHNVEFSINFDHNNISIEKNKNLDNILFNISFNSDDLDFIWKDKVFKCILSMNDGNLKLFNNETLYGNLFKENKISYYLKNI